jgi:DNA topoisomerase-2
MSKKSVEQIYIKLTPEEHILQRPDTYVGATVLQEKSMWCTTSIDPTNIKITKQNITYTPALLKLFDEILTNASDHVQRDQGVKTIKVNIDDDWNINVWNDGTGIPVVKHKEHNLYVPELIFGHLHTGSNYDDTEERYGAGRNGLGSKLVSLFSDKFIIETADKKKIYYQELTNNNKDKSKPIVKRSTKSFTSITYKADFTRLPLGDKTNSDNLKRLCLKRTIDIAAFNPNVKVYFNDTLINIKKIDDWCKLHLHTGSELFTEKINDNWTVGLAQTTTDKFEHCSIVNGNTTWQGGTHVDYIIKQVYSNLITLLTKGKNGLKIKPNDIKSKFHLFLICKIANPVFDTQTKENLTLKINDTALLSDAIFKKLIKSDIIQSILDWIELKEQAALRKVNSKSAGKILRVNKLIDAHKAGTTSGYKASLCIAEGDSAKGTIVSGLSVVGRDYWGVFPIKGRPLNVRNVPVSKIINNEEISNIIKIIGLVPGKKYTSLKELRYGKIVFFTDADTFGTSIKGLLINFIHKLWPELLELGFCYEFITPIVKAKKGKRVIDYYDLDKYNQDNLSGKLQGFKTKYYKGLGTISSTEIKEMFKNIDKHLIKFNYVQDRDSDTIDMLFNTKRASERKDWLNINQNFEHIPDKTNGLNEVSDFIDTEFIQFSHYDNEISIPELIDGFKPSQRKIMYGAFKRGLKTNVDGEIKVAQFGSYVAEQTHFAHGEANMYGTIVGMAQDFVGANNIPLLMPSGNFGSRANPAASASPRYIFTYMNNVTPYIFRKEDESILVDKFEDDHKIEPEYYLPIIPTVLVNGANGIGTGWSTDIPKYNAKSLIKIIRKKLANPDIKYKISPAYNGWNGDIVWDKEANRFITKGVYTLSKDKKQILITELPINMATEKYITLIDKLIDTKVLKKIVDNSTDTDINITVTVGEKINYSDLYKQLKLTTTLSLNNLHTFVNGKIKQWDNIEHLLDTWFDIRLEKYKERKIEHIKVENIRYNKYFNIVCFLNAVMQNKVIINKRSKSDIIKDLEHYEFDKIDDSYNYLLNIPIYHFSKEKYNEYKALAKEIKTNLEEYKKLSANELWDRELVELYNLL